MFYLCSIYVLFVSFLALDRKETLLFDIVNKTGRSSGGGLARPETRLETWLET